MTHLDEIRSAEKTSHIEAYSQNELFAEGSWLSKPVKTVMDILPLFKAKNYGFRALDIGCGIGRNCIPVAKAFKEIGCRIDCVDILEFAIKKLKENAEKYGVADEINGIVSSIDSFEIKEDTYDLIIAVSALEHIDSEKSFIKKLKEIRRGIRRGGIVCLIVNTSICEIDKASGAELPPQFEVNFRTEELQSVLERIFADDEIIKNTVKHQRYDIPRECGLVELEADVVTLVVRK